MGRASHPHDPLSPFSETNRALREADFAQFGRLLAGTTTTVAPDLAPCIGQLLWLYQMGVILLWFHDESDGQTRTQGYCLIAASAPWLCSSGWAHCR